jgi:predicted acetyltransferase
MDENMKFIEPKIEYEEQIRTYRQELLNSGSSMDGTGALRRMEDPRQWIEHCKRSTKKKLSPIVLIVFSAYWVL